MNRDTLSAIRANCVDDEAYQRVLAIISEEYPPAYRQVVESSLQGIVILQDGKVVFANPAMAQMTGYSISEYLSLTAEDFPQTVHPDDRKMVWERHQARLQGKDVPDRYEFRAIRKDGSTWWMEMQTQMIEFDGRAAVQAFIIDNTQRHKAEHALRDSEEKFRGVFEGASIGVMLAPLDNHKFVEINQAACDILGYARHELLGLTFRDITYPDDLYASEVATADLEAGKRSHYELEKRYLHKDGQPVWCYVNLNLVEIGDTTFTVIYLRNITRRKMMEEALIESEHKFRALMNQAGVGIGYYDLDGTALFFNEKAAQYLGGIPEDFMGKHVAELLGDKWGSVIEARFQATLLAGQQQSFDDDIDLPGGHRNFISTYSPIYNSDDTPIGMQVISDDITPIVKAQEAIQTAHQQCLAVLSGLDIGIRVTEIGSGEQLYINGAAKAIQADGLPEHLIEVDSKTPFIWQAKSDTGRWYEMRDSAIHWVDGHLVHMQVAMDITERKALEKSTLELSLERERVALLKGFISDATHEFRTPLSVINTSAALMMVADDAEQRQRRHARISESVHRITDLLDSVLHVVRLDSHFELRRVLVNVKAFLRQVARLQTDEIEQAQQHLTVVLPAEDFLFLADADQLQLALQHLLQNANHFTPAGGDITLSAHKEGEDLMITIADSGIGMDEETLAQAFHHFYRADRARTQRGLGLGLPIVKRIIELHAGQLRVESEPQRGTRVTITLPIVPSA